jgi:hypothetical protein
MVLWSSKEITMPACSSKYSKFVQLLALSLFAGLALTVRADVITWTNTAGNWAQGGNWDLQRPPTAGDQVVINTGASILLTNETPVLLAFNMNGGTLAFSNWTTRLQATTVVLGGGTLTHTGPITEADMSNRVWVACTDLHLGTNATISVNGKGYKADNGAGAGVDITGGGGGGYGGLGGFTLGKAPTARGEPYGVAANPDDPGSGGGRATAGAGGGTVRIECASKAAIYGTIIASGSNGSSDGGGGSGGALFVQCNELAGSPNGLLSAPGGGGQDTGGGGGGGRIAVHYAVAPAINPGIRFAVSGGAKGGRSFAGQPGTLYLSDTALLTETLSITQFSNVRLFLGVPAWTVNNLTAANSTLTFAGDGFRLNVNQNMQISGATAFGFGDSTCTGMTLAVHGNLTVTNGGTFFVYSGATNGTSPAYGCLVTVAGDIVVAPTATRIYPVAHELNGGAVQFRSRNLNIAANCAINGDAAGWRPDYGPGRGIKVGNSGGGGGYGGKGGAGGYGGAGGGIYPHPYLPTLPGSGGSLSGNYGGGSLQFELTGRAKVDGSLTANGGPAYGAYGGGSGGGILIRCQVFSGGLNGQLSAKGGNGGTRGGGGGGGRISVLMGISAKDQDQLLHNEPVGSLTISTNHIPFQGQSLINGGLAGTDKGFAGASGTVFFLTSIRGTVLMLR